MTNLKIHSDFYADPMLASSFFALQRLVFPEIDLEQAYQRHFLSADIIPWGIFDGKQALSILNASKMTVMLHGEIKQAIQIGTVSTHPAYRHQGLAKQLFLRVLDTYAVDFVFLMANDTVLDYYPKYGFKPQAEHVFRQQLSHTNQANSFRQLQVDEGSNHKILRHAYAEREPLSNTFAVLNHSGLALWYCELFLSDQLWYNDETETLIVAKQEGAMLRVYDVVTKKIDPKFFESFSWPEVQDVVLHFVPDRFVGKFEPERDPGDCQLFYKGDVVLASPYVKVPELART